MRRGGPPCTTPTVGRLPRLVRGAVFPGVVVCTAVMALAATAGSGPLPVPRAVSADAVRYVAIIGAAYLAIALCERVLPHRPDWNRAHGDVRTDVAHLVFTALPANEAAKLLLSGLVVGAGAWLSARLGSGLWPEAWPPIAQLMLAIVVAEFGSYWFHRFSHESALAWRFHAVHHSAPRLYWLNATRFHPVDLFGRLVCQNGLLVLLGIPTRSFMAYAIFAGVYGQLQHSNIDVRTGGLRWLFSTPDLHRWHHSTDPREANANYGAISSVWDRMFGTFFFPTGRRLTDPVGLAAQAAFPTTYLGQLAAPLRADLPGG